MALIFCASTDLGRSENSARWIAPIVRFFFPTIGNEGLASVDFGVRKAGHVTGYAILAGLLLRALRKRRRNDPRPWCWKSCWIAVLLAGCYAATDEFHQSFNPHRTGHWPDVVLDTAGATIGVLAVWMFESRSKSRSRRTGSSVGN